MKKRSLLLMFMLIFGITILFAQREAKKFAIKSGHIEYELTGSTEGKKTIWFDDFGLKYREEIISTTTTKVFAFKNTEENHDITIMMGKDYTSIDMLKKTGTTGELHFYEDLQEDYYNMTEEEKKEFEEDLINSFGGERLGNETFLGRNCEVVLVMGVKSWIYKGVTLKSEINVLGQKSFEVATLIEEDITVPATLFEVPEGIKISEFKSLYHLFDDVDNEKKKEMEKKEQSEEENEFDDMELAPITYSFEDFSKAMEKVSIDDYPRTTTLNLENEFMCMFMKSAYKAISIVATSNKDKDGAYFFAKEENEFENFTHNGLKMFYGNNIDKNEEEDETMLGIEYPKYDIVIIIASNQEFTKEDLLKIADQLDL